MQEQMQDLELHAWMVISVIHSPAFQKNVGLPSHGVLKDYGILESQIHMLLTDAFCMLSIRSRRRKYF